MVRVITINYFYSVVNYPYVNIQKFATQLGPVIYDVTQSIDTITETDRTTNSLQVLISDSVPLKRSDFPSSRREFLKCLVNYDDFFKVIAKKENSIRRNVLAKNNEYTYPTPQAQIDIVLLNIKMYVKEIFKELSILKLPNDSQQRSRITNQKYYTIVNDWNFIFEPYQNINEFEYFNDLKERYALGSDIDGTKEREQMKIKKDKWSYVKPNGTKVYLEFDNNEQIEKYFIDYNRLFNSFIVSTSILEDTTDNKDNQVNYTYNFKQDLEDLLTSNGIVITNQVNRDLQSIEDLLKEHKQFLLQKTLGKKSKYNIDQTVEVKWTRTQAELFHKEEIKEQKKATKNFQEAALNTVDELMQQLHKAVIKSFKENDSYNVEYLDDSIANNISELKYIPEGNIKGIDKSTENNIEFDILKKGLNSISKSRTDDIYEAWLKSLVPIWSQANKTLDTSRGTTNTDDQLQQKQDKYIILKELLEKYTIYDYLIKYDWKRYEIRKNRELNKSNIVDFSRRLFVYKLMNDGLDVPMRNTQEEEDDDDEDVDSFTIKNITDVVLRNPPDSDTDIGYLEILSNNKFAGFKKDNQEIEENLDQDEFTSYFQLHGEIILRDEKTPIIYKKFNRTRNQPAVNEKKMKEYNMYSFPNFESLVKFNIKSSSGDKDAIRDFYREFKNKSDVDVGTYQKYFQVNNVKENMSLYEITLKDLVAIKIDPRPPKALKQRIASNKCNTSKIMKLANAFRKTLKATGNRINVLKNLGFRAGDRLFQEEGSDTKSEIIDIYDKFNKNKYNIEKLRTELLEKCKTESLNKVNAENLDELKHHFKDIQELSSKINKEVKNMKKEHIDTQIKLIEENNDGIYSAEFNYYKKYYEKYKKTQQPNYKRYNTVFIELSILEGLYYGRYNNSALKELIEKINEVIDQDKGRNWIRQELGKKEFKEDFKNKVETKIKTLKTKEKDTITKNIKDLKVKLNELKIKDNIEKYLFTNDTIDKYELGKFMGYKDKFVKNTLDTEVDKSYPQLDTSVDFYKLQEIFDNRRIIKQGMDYINDAINFATDIEQEKSKWLQDTSNEKEGIEITLKKKSTELLKKQESNRYMVKPEIIDGWYDSIQKGKDDAATAAADPTPEEEMVLEAKTKQEENKLLEELEIDIDEYNTYDETNKNKQLQEQKGYYMIAEQLNMDLSDFYTKVKELEQRKENIYILDASYLIKSVYEKESYVSFELLNSKEAQINLDGSSLEKIDISTIVGFHDDEIDIDSLMGGGNNSNNITRGGKIRKYLTKRKIKKRYNKKTRRL